LDFTSALLDLNREDGCASSGWPRRGAQPCSAPQWSRADSTGGTRSPLRKEEYCGIYARPKPQAPVGFAGIGAFSALADH
jgi:hypothetical protein